MNTPKMPRDTTSAMLTTKFVNHFCRRNLSDSEVLFIYNLMTILSRSEEFREELLNSLSRMTVDYANAPLVRQGQGIEGDMRVTIPSAKTKSKAR